MLRNARAQRISWWMTMRRSVQCCWSLPHRPFEHLQIDFRLILVQLDHLLYGTEGMKGAIEQSNQPDDDCQGLEANFRLPGRRE